MKILKFIDHILNFIVFSFFILSLSFAGYALYDINAVYDDTLLSGEILKYKPSVDEYGLLKKNFSINDLQKINKDIVGWIRIDDTNIDYPILAGKDNTSYLKTDYKGDYSPSGSIFLDYRNSRELNDDFFVIYGHNMAKNLMFSDIKKFQKDNYFNEHSTGKLYTNHGVYNLTILTFNIIDANKSAAYKLQRYSNEHNDVIIQELLGNAIFKKDIEVNPSDKLILLSTCYGVGTYDRSVILAKLEESDASSLIHDNTSDLQKKEFEKIEQKVIKENEKNNLVNRIIVLIIYIMIAVMIYIRLSIVHRKRKRKTRKKKK